MKGKLKEKWNGVRRKDIDSTCGIVVVLGLLLFCVCATFAYNAIIFIVEHGIE